MYNHGWDREGHPLIIVRAARHNPYDRDIEQVLAVQLWIIDQVR